MLSRKIMMKPSGAGAWSPSDLSGLLAWYDASDSGSLTLTGSLVDQWNDLSGNGNHFTASGTARPTYGATSFNTSKPGITFDGGDAISKATSSYGGGTVLSAFVVGTYANNAGGAYDRMLSYSMGSNDYSNANSAAFLLQDNTNLAIQGFRGNAAKSTSAALTAGTAYRFGSVFDGTNHTIYINNSASSAVSSTGTFGANGLISFGAEPPALTAATWTGIVAEIILCTDDLTAGSTARSDMDNYFTTRWGL